MYCTYMCSLASQTAPTAAFNSFNIYKHMEGGSGKLPMPFWIHMMYCNAFMTLHTRDIPHYAHSKSVLTLVGLAENIPHSKDNHSFISYQGDVQLNVLSLTNVIHIPVLCKLSDLCVKILVHRSKMV